ncbi:acetate kinase [Acidothermaceae bacterium B102]|nr:acetate kinase [Acidothermaceae bacterium B102]
MSAPVLVLNCGSSSVKWAVVDPTTGETSTSGLAERLGSADARVRTKSGAADWHDTPTPDLSPEDAVGKAISLVRGTELGGVGHRVVQGGERFTASVRIDDDVIAGIDALSGMAPLHNPINLVGIRAAMKALPELTHVAVFDTSFHQTMPPRAYRYAVPQAWYTEHKVRRYGAHGTSVRYVSRRTAELLDRPLADLALVVAHLGNGCSATAVLGGLSVDTTMGLTPLAGLVMGTRSGDIDPSVFSYLVDQTGMTVDDITTALNKQSGLLGLSGLSNDLRAISEAAGQGNADAVLALEVFCYRLARDVAALVVPLGRLDALVFTGGIGENSAVVRSKVLAMLGFLGLEENIIANAAHGRDHHGRVSLMGSPVALVVPTNEELVIAQDTAALT